MKGRALLAVIVVGVALLGLLYWDLSTTPMPTPTVTETVKETVTITKTVNETVTYFKGITKVIDLPNETEGTIVYGEIHWYVVKSFSHLQYEQTEVEFRNIIFTVTPKGKVLEVNITFPDGVTKTIYVGGGRPPTRTNDSVPEWKPSPKFAYWRSWRAGVVYDFLTDRLILLVAQRG